MSDDPLSRNFANAGQSFKFSRSGSINVDSLVGFNF